MHAARVVSFLFAVTVTWQFNRRFTFAAGHATRHPFHEWARYLASSLLGGAVNYAAFSLAIAVSALARRHLVIGVAIGAAAGMVVNYLLYSRYVFGRAAAASEPRGSPREG